MNCPICYADFYGNVCPNCGMDVKLYDRIKKMSDMLYNKGLKRARISDLTSAEEFLNKSILFNKRNIDARNLLGLVYFETGQINLAVKQWVISLNLKKENNLANEYIDYFQNNQKVFDKFNDAIKMYNQAVKFMQQDSDDMAVIQLRKAVDLNPKFIDALNLLSLCYIIQKKNDKALETVKTVLNIDLSNPNALEYFNELQPDKERPMEAIKMSKQGGFDRTVRFEPKISRKNAASKGSKFMEIALFLAGCICTAAIMYILVVPGAIEEKQQEIDKVTTEMSSLQKKFDEESVKSEEQIANLQKENEDLKNQNQEISKQANSQNAANQLANASTLLAQGDKTQAAAVISSIDTSILPQEQIETYNSVKNEAFSFEANRLLNEGKKFVTSKKYEEAKSSLEKSLSYSENDNTAKYSAMYYLGKSLGALGDKEKAKEYLNQVVQNHPQSKFKNWASGELASLQ